MLRNFKQRELCSKIGKIIELENLKDLERM